MKSWSRRDVLKTGLAASAGSVTLGAGVFAPTAGAQPESIIAATGLPAAAEGGSPLRERALLDFGWKFALGNANDPEKDFGFGSASRGRTFSKSGDMIGWSRKGEPVITSAKFNDSEWRSVDLPHDWAVELPFINAKTVEQGAKALGREYPETSVGWYRRVFKLGEGDESKRITLEFDGVMRQAMVILNGHYIGENMSGYAPFTFDVTDWVNLNEPNVLLVRADVGLGEGWFYEGAGIYRHVWLTKTGPVHSRDGGTFVRAEVRGASAQVTLSSEVANESDQPRTCRVAWQLMDSDGKEAGSAQSQLTEIPAWSTQRFDGQATVAESRLWSCADPHLYRAVTRVEADGTALDETSTSFGIRSLRWDADQGFFLNDKPVKIKGTCNHQDHAGVGAALPDSMQQYRIERLQSMGCNGLRTSHNPPTPELMAAADRLGMLVMCETRMMDSSREGLSELERMIRKYRNHPSIVIWSLGNEEPEQGTPRGVKIVTTMKRLARKLDPTRMTTVAMNDQQGKGVSAVVDVQGFNYNENRIDAFHKAFPRQPMIGTETASTVSTRGIYANDKEAGYVSAYDLNFPPWAATAEKWWKTYDERPFLAGGFAWTGFDYRGEPTPYGWPCISSHFGILDTCGFPKDNYFYYRAWWGSEPALHLFPHWNWAGKEGQEIDVWVHSNLESVELFLNGTSLGSQKVTRNDHPAWKVKYAPGVLEARGSKAGSVVLTEKRETTGSAARLALRAERKQIAADGEDAAVIVVEVQDSQGRVVPTAGNTVKFHVNGAGKIIGVGNGDPSCHEADKAEKRSAFNGLCMAIVQSSKRAGEVRIDASAQGLEGASVTISTKSATSRGYEG
jgi:beta-galactosidase